MTTTITEMSAWELLQQKLTASTNPDALMLTTTEAAAYLNVTKNSLAVMRYRKKGPDFVQIGKGTIRYPKKALDKWIENSTVHTTGGDK
ncbi:helix-turn-helix domain-containing protein [Bifidobacterium pseudolongum]|uniref:helix-turn-helix domain-containing protein n=1 Tax=Bifidobacterium pseudolongum TaxID=1694 RepID=UPI003F8DD629